MKDKVIELGDLAEDAITKYRGIVVSLSRHLTGCDRVTLQSQDVSEGKIPDAYGFDISTVRVIKRQVVPCPPDRMLYPEAEKRPEARPGGPPMRIPRHSSR